ncbi:MAG: hypothetical protein LBR09_00745 [Endomicrobium sp.]|jgi:hypothetical protein|nr:hypothetical protein [Endomicrobium sp.]
MMKKFLVLLFIIVLFTGCIPTALLDKELANVEEDLLDKIVRKVDSRLDSIIERFSKFNKQLGIEL